MFPNTKNNLLLNTKNNLLLSTKSNVFLNTKNNVFLSTFILCAFMQSILYGYSFKRTVRLFILNPQKRQIRPNKRQKALLYGEITATRAVRCCSKMPYLRSDSPVSKPVFGVWKFVFAVSKSVLRFL